MTSIDREIVLDNATKWFWLSKFIGDNYKAFFENGKPLSVTITNSARRRNAEQNKRYWRGVLQQMAEQVWVDGKQFSKDVWHEFYAEKFGYFEEIDMPDGTRKLRRKSTTEYTVKEFAEYMTKIEVDAAQEYGVMFQEYSR